MSAELEEVIDAIGFKFPLSEVQKAALRKVSPEIRMLRAALAMFDTTPNVLVNVLDQTVSQWKRSCLEPKTPSPAGGAVKMGNSVGQSEPQPLSLEQLESLIPEATKEATTFEKAPDLGLAKVGDTFVVRVKRIHKGAYETPLVIAGEFAPFADGKLGTVVTEDRRVETFAVRRAMEKGIKLVEGQVYLLKLVGEKATKFSNPYRQAVVILIGTDFPKAAAK
jgi:hypothetical protein